MDVKAPTRWAADIRRILKAAFGDACLPVDVAHVAKGLSEQWFPDDPISAVIGEDLPGFDGALVRDPAGKKGWLILYNARIDSPGRVRFTTAHEFGHYLQHREISPEGFHCRGEDFVRWDPAYLRIENEANQFAANLLMPLDDLRTVIPERMKVDFEILGYCTERYGVSMIAVVLRWLEYTAKRAVIVLSRDGFILWSRASSPAFQSSLFIKTKGRPPVDVPAHSAAAQAIASGVSRCARDHPPGIWFAEECEEFLLPSERYDFAISMLMFSDTPPDWETRQANRMWGLGSRS